MCNLIKLNEVIDLLVSPTSKKSLVLKDNKLINDNETFNILNGLPVLFIEEALEYLGTNSIKMPYKKYSESIKQYLYINNIKMYYGNHNSDYKSKDYIIYSKRAIELTKDIQGSVLDIGCDNPIKSLTLFPKNIKYLGVEPLFEDSSYFRIIAMAEFLPIKDNSFDNVCFMTSLDHIFDYYKALSEAKRVLITGGKLVIATLIWEDNYELCNDHVHFHHFKNYEIFGALNMLGFSIQKINRYKYKDDTFRNGLFLIATKN